MFLPLFFGAALAQFFQNPFIGGFPIRKPDEEAHFEGFGRAPIKKADYETRYDGEWELVSHDSGVSAMHLVLMPNDKAIMFDTTFYGPSNIQLPPGNCRFYSSGNETKEDCWAHAVEYDIHTGFVRPLKVHFCNISFTLNPYMHSFETSPIRVGSNAGFDLYHA